MSDDAQKPKKHSLSEISHLFLSSVRDRQTHGSAKPNRVPPPRDVSIDLTPEEFAQVYGSASQGSELPRRSVPVTALIGAHLNGSQFERVKTYARHRAGVLGRVGLIEVDGSEFRLMAFGPAAPLDDAEEDVQTECVEPRQMSEALEEMNWDVDEWLLLLPNPRTPEARAILRDINQWVLLCTCDHDGVVSAYRLIKGLAESIRPRLTLAVLDAQDDAEAGRVYQKLSGVCQQFLNWPLEAEPPVRPAPGVSEHLVLLYRSMRDKAQLAAAPQWAVVSEFLEAGKNIESAAPAEEPRLVADVVVPAVSATVVTDEMPKPVMSPGPVSPEHTVDDVIDLPSGDASGQSILEAMLRQANGALIECPLRPPMCVEARLAVSRNGGMVLLIAARQGLSDLRMIGQAYRWLTENRELIRMAVPQFAIDIHQTPRLRLIVDRADLSADALHPMLQSDHVTIQAYRKLRWGQRVGVFLEAA